MHYNPRQRNILFEHKNRSRVHTVTMPLTADADIPRETLTVKEHADVYEEDYINTLLYSIFGGFE
ncbi:MAG: hypothetical protein MJ142_07915 [Clostridia bacterium]|nr:hypothetical protein [Clostridia bacterium]